MNGTAEPLTLQRPQLSALSTCVHHLEQLYEYGFLKTEPAHDFFFKEGLNHSWMCSLQAEHPEGASARCAIIGSPKIEFINLMIFPKQSRQAPIFASEIILFGSKVHVAVIDHQTPEPNGPLRPEIGKLLQPLQTHYASKLSPGGEFPDWARQHFTPWCIYSRPVHSSETSTVCSAFCTYLDLWLNSWLPRLNSIPEDQSLMNAYLHHHKVNLPGRVFLDKAFGTEWAERYLNEFLYAPLD